MMRKPTTVLVYNPLSGHGHLDSWLAMFVSILLSRGYRVLALTPDREALIQRLSDAERHASALEILVWDDLKPSFLRRAMGRLKRLLPWGTKARAVAEQASGPLGSPVESDPEQHYLEPDAFFERVAKACRKRRVGADLVLNMYMDLYRSDVARWQAAEISRAWPGLGWVGLRFIPRAVPSEGYYQLKSLQGMCLFDETVVARYQHSLPDKSFAYLPDITHAELPEAPSARVLQIKALAKDRKIVFMGGTIAATKNLAKWLAVVRQADPKKWFFVQIGEIHTGALPPDDFVAYQGLMAAKPEHLYVETGYLPDERAFNEIIACADLIFAVYRDFTNSSNMLGKAAAFEKPILVADQHLMGHRVQAYGLGQAVAQDDVEQMLAALTTLLDRPLKREGYAAYRRDFSQEALRERLFGLIDRCVETQLSRGTPMRTSLMSPPP